MTTMEGASGSSFGIDTILSSASSGSPGMMNGDFRPLGEARTADFRSQATPSPCSEIDTVGTAPSSPISVTMEPPEPHLVADGPQHHHHLHHSQPPPPPPAAAPAPSLQPSPPQPPPPPQPPAQHPGSAASAPRTSTSSFLIKDILGDSKPLAACAPYSTSVSSPHHTPKPESNAAHESFRPKLEQEDGKGKLDKREDSQGDLKCHGESRCLGCLGRPSGVSCGFPVTLRSPAGFSDGERFRHHLWRGRRHSPNPQAGGRTRPKFCLWLQVYLSTHAAADTHLSWFYLI